MVLLYFLSASTIQTPQHSKREGTYWEEEETCPKASPLTLTSITKGQKNIGKEKKVEIEEEEEDEREEQVRLESPTQE